MTEVQPTGFKCNQLGLEPITLTTHEEAKEPVLPVMAKSAVVHTDALRAPPSESESPPLERPVRKTLTTRIKKRMTRNEGVQSTRKKLTLS